MSPIEKYFFQDSMLRRELLLWSALQKRLHPKLYDVPGDSNMKQSPLMSCGTNLMGCGCAMMLTGFLMMFLFALLLGVK